MRIIVTGDVNFDDWKLLKRKLNVLTVKLTNIEISITGYDTYLGKSTDRCGAEHHAANWCGRYLYTYYVYHTETFFSKDKGGPERRLEQMFAEADRAVFFWNGKDKWTKDMIRRAKKAKLDHRVIRYKGF